jgi:hypothetical protein
MDSTALVTYNITEAQIANTREACEALTCDTSAGYEEVRIAIGNLRATRTAIEKRRVELKADALAFGRLVDTEAARFTRLILEIEDPLKAKKAVIDDEAARIKREKELAAAKLIQDEIDRKAAEKLAAEKAVRDAEEARLAEERAKLVLEREALIAQRLALEAAANAELARAAAARKVEQDRMDAERAKVDAERRAVEALRQQGERAEFERLAKINAEKLAYDVLERARVEKARQDAELAALAPDLEKVATFANAIRSLQAPKVKSKRLADMLATTMQGLGDIAAALESTAARARGGK